MCKNLYSTIGQKLKFSHKGGETVKYTGKANIYQMAADISSLLNKVAYLEGFTESLRERISVIEEEKEAYHS